MECHMICSISIVYEISTTRPRFYGTNGGQRRAYMNRKIKQKKKKKREEEKRKRKKKEERQGQSRMPMPRLDA